MLKLAPLILILAVLPAKAEDAALSACALKAGELLPRVPGLTITKSSARASPRSTKDGTTLLVVDMDFRAAGQDHRKSYMCGVVSDGTAMIISEWKD